MSSIAIRVETAWLVMRLAFRIGRTIVRGPRSLGEHWEFEKSMRICASNSGRSFLLFVRWNRIRKYEPTPMQQQRVRVKTRLLGWGLRGGGAPEEADYFNLAMPRRKMPGG